MRRILALTMALLLLTPFLCAQLFGGKKTDDFSAPRNLTGAVLDHDERPVANALVSLKNTRTLAVVTFITTADGSYHFNNLSPNVDYEVRAESNGLRSAAKTLSSFDTRKAARIVLKLEKEK